MPNTKNSQSGFAPIFLLVIFAVVTSAGYAAYVPVTDEYPENVYQVAVLGDEQVNVNAEELEKKEEELKRYEEEMRLKKELKLKEAERLKLERKEKEAQMLKEKEQVMKQKQRKEELMKKQAALRKEAEKQKVMRDASESAKLNEELERLALELEEEADDKVVLEQVIGDLNLKYKYENGKLVVKAQAKNGAEIEVEDPEIMLVKEQLEQSLKQKGIEVASGSGQLVIGKDKFKAKSKFPVSVDPETNQLMIETPKGQKVVAVLPDQAVQNMLQKKVLSEVPTDGHGEDSEIELENRNDQVVYKLKGKKIHKVFGVMPITTETTAFVSVDNGELVAKEESAFSRLLGFVSF